MIDGMKDKTDGSQPKVRTYTWNGKTFPISYPDLSDEMIAGTVRMLLRDQLNHEAVCCAARDRIMCLVAEKAAQAALIRQLVGALRTTRDALDMMMRDGYEGVWDERDFAGRTQPADAALAAAKEAGYEA